MEVFFCAGEHSEDFSGFQNAECGEVREFDAYAFFVFAADLGDGLVVEGFAEAV